jgi:hypothetical protein
MTSQNECILSETTSGGNPAVCSASRRICPATAGDLKVSGSAKDEKNAE